MKRIDTALLALFVCAIFLAAALPAGAASPAEYGRMIINNHSARAGLAAVEFDHWLHRSLYTCTVCHVDIGFSLKAGATGIRAEDNRNGIYCGACHNGKMQVGGKAVFAACTDDRTDAKRCERCHAQGKNVKREHDFAAFTAKFPKSASGNGIDWEKAAEDGTVKPSDYLEGVSLKRSSRRIENDFAIQPKSPGMAEIIFSHRKHMNWNGCESCHPEIFKGGKRGSTVYSMAEIRQKKFCGVCHATVAFPIEDCSRCHAKPMK